MDYLDNPERRRETLLAAVRIRINLAETSEGRCRIDVMGEVRRDGIRSRIVA
jgi:hypothetical protein